MDTLYFPFLLEIKVKDYKIILYFHSVPKTFHFRLHLKMKTKIMSLQLSIQFVVSCLRPSDAHFKKTYFMPLNLKFQFYSIKVKKIKLRNQQNTPNKLKSKLIVAVMNFYIKN